MADWGYLQRRFYTPAIDVTERRKLITDMVVKQVEASRPDVSEELSVRVRELEMRHEEADEDEEC